MKKNSGSTLLAVLSLLVILSAFIYAASTYTMSISRNIVNTNALRTATEVGDGALEYAFAHWRGICRVSPTTQFPHPAVANPVLAAQNILSTGSTPAIPLPTAAMFPGIANFTVSAGPNPAAPGTPYTISNYGVQAVTPLMVPMGTSTTPPTAGVGTNVDSNSFFYLASADVTIRGFVGHPVTAHVRRIFQKQQQSPWSDAIFYNDLLEVNPGAPMTISGWVHTNGYLYTDMADLTFTGRVDYGTDWADGNAWAPGDTDHPPQAPAPPTYAASEPPVMGPIQQPFGIDVAAINATNHTNQTAAQVYSELIAPGNSNADFGTNSYYNQSAVRIIVNSSDTVSLHATTGVVTAGLQDDHVISAASPAGSADLALYKVFTAAVTPGATIQDNREGAAVRVATIDMSVIYNALIPYNNSTNNSAIAGTLMGLNPPFNGIVYATDSSGTAAASSKRAFLLKNGANMPPGGLTVASNNGVYIQGDYNTGQTASAKTPANANNDGTGSNVASPGGVAYTEQPSAVLGDAVMILSNNWSNANAATLAARVATPTTVNAAILSGNVPTNSVVTGANSYSGGAENFPRFLEDWGGKTITDYGSMVELFQSQQFTGYWGSAAVYGAPNRNWNFDTLFYTSPPPGTLITYSFIQQRWFVQ
jgi:hypothetical protein